MSVTTLPPATTPTPTQLDLLSQPTDVRLQAAARAARPDYPAWLEHVRSAAGCTRPVRLHGELYTLRRTGPDSAQIVGYQHTESMPDGVIYKACGNRRASACPSCSQTYRRDAFRVFRSGLVGGDGITETVAEHPTLFVTLTAPSFGPVHTRYVKRHTCRRRDRCQCRAEPCRPRRDRPRCPHGRPLFCFARHEDTDESLGAPLCPDCYDHPGHVVWNLTAGELWRRTTIAITRHLRRLAKERGIPFHTVPTPDGQTRKVAPLKLSFGKAAEFQRRAVVHFHAIIRLDGHDPDTPAAILPPPAGLHTQDLVDAVNCAARRTGFCTEAHPARPAGWHITWGEQLDVQVITVHDNGPVTDRMVSDYLAKYATKSTETTGHISPRLTHETIRIYAHPLGTHTERLVNACWALGQARSKTWRGLWRWAHMLGFGGHFATKSRRYGRTFAFYRTRRLTHRRAQTTGPQPDNPTPQQETTLVVNFLRFVGAGWHTTGDALLANASAAMAREHQQAVSQLPTTLAA